MHNDVTYYKIREVRTDPLLGSYLTYAIVAMSASQPTIMIPDVSTDHTLVSKMVKCFNELGLSAIHLYDVIFDMLE